MCASETTPHPRSGTSAPISPEQIDSFHKAGLVRVRGLFSPEEIAVLRHACSPEQGLPSLQTHVRDMAERTYKVAIWTHLDDSLFGKLPRMPRIASCAQALLGEPVYHWHSKLLRKEHGDGGVGIHQDFATWYEDGCLAPNMLTCTIATDTCSKKNGCVYFVPGSHRMARIHRVRLGETSDTHGPDPARVDELVRRFGVVHGELEPGDALFFHSMTLHGSDPNLSKKPRTLLHLSYNAQSNQPISRPRQEHHRYRPLTLVEDDFLTTGKYDSLRHPSTFHKPEKEGDAGAGIFYRPADADVASQ